jgi:hypothetical protein
MKHSFLREQVVPLSLTVLTFFALCVLLYSAIAILNFFPSAEKIHPEVRFQDVLVGMTIYLKTAIDFAIFIGNLMHSNPGWKNRIAIEVGTAFGNTLGTILILVIWNFFREVPLLMAIMIVIASLVLLRMAQDSLEEFLHNRYKNANKPLRKPISFLEQQLGMINKFVSPLLGKLIPETGMTNTKKLSFWNLAWFSFTIPFVLGLDDFAGYIPLFSVINVFGFSVGVFLGHMLLNASLFLSPVTTTKIIRHPLILLIGGLAFVGLAGWGFYEVLRILEMVFFH